MMTIYCHAQIACDSETDCAMSYETRHGTGLSNGEAEGVGRTRQEAVAEARRVAKGHGWTFKRGLWQCRECSARQP